jgi:high-affinity nickel-transport protein
MTAALAAAFLGLTLGARHAFEPDHLAAVSTLAAEKEGARAGLWLGALWGLGHSLSLLLVAGTLALLQVEMPAKLALCFEIAVALMVIGLGLNALRRAVREGPFGATTTHRHGGTLHTHAAVKEHLHLGKWTLASRPLWVGLMHGLAGSGALVALVPLALSSVGEKLLYIATFGAGSILGMAVLTGLVGAPLAWLSRTPRLASAVLAMAGVFAVGTGLVWGWHSTSQLFG